MRKGQEWPDAVWLVRHGESSGNVARDEAESAGHPMIDIEVRDMDVPLSDRGERQAKALGAWIGARPENERPTAMLSSPYTRACQTAEIVASAAGIDCDIAVDERLREREFGILDRLTKAGITERFPEQAELRAFLGKFYHRPPGGESWADVVLRLRSVVDTITREYRSQRLMVVTHQVVVLMFRYLFEGLREQEVLAIDKEVEVANCSVTLYEYDPDDSPTGTMALRRFNDTEPVQEEGEEVTAEPDRKAPRP
jgi:2,3-bisphosphoglycerate-dependent phosphoglycerate mutase